MYPDIKPESTNRLKRYAQNKNFIEYLLCEVYEREIEESEQSLASVVLWKKGLSSAGGEKSEKKIEKKA